MFSNPRSTPFYLYRLFFVLLIYVTGIASTSVWILESFTDIRIIPEEMGTTYDALLATSGVTGVSGIVAGSLLLSLMSDRRIAKLDRRQRQVDINFADRRISERRSST